MAGKEDSIPGEHEARTIVKHRTTAKDLQMAITIRGTVVKMFTTFVSRLVEYMRALLVIRTSLFSLTSKLFGTMTATACHRLGMFDGYYF